MDQKSVLTYSVLFERAPEGGYVAFVPVLPGCMTQGETFEETRNNIEDAIIGYIAILKEDGDEVPEEYTEHIAATVAVTAWSVCAAITIHALLNVVCYLESLNRPVLPRSNFCKHWIRLIFWQHR